MADKTGIEWADATWNPVRGCTRVSPGCGGPNHEGGCYAERIAARFSGEGQPFHGFAERVAIPTRAAGLAGGSGAGTRTIGRWTGKLALVESALDLPLRWRKPRRIFVNSMSDLFHENLPDEAIARVFNVMAGCPQHTFQVLTKRADRMRAMMSGPKDHSLWSPKLWHRSTLPNVWLGVSVEDQARADERRQPLAELAGRGWTTFVSYEPALGPVDWAGWGSLRWLISGGESGVGARPSHPDWHRRARDFCETHRVAYFFKQWGEWAPHRPVAGDNLPDDVRAGKVRIAHPTGQSDVEVFRQTGGRNTIPGSRYMKMLGKKRAGRLLDGREHSEFPR